MQKFIKSIEGDEIMLRCLKCKDSKNGTIGKKMLVNSVYLHIQSKKHRANTPDNEIGQLEKLIEEIESYEGKKKQVRSNKEENDSENYLKFLGFLMSKNLSFFKYKTLEII